MIDRNVMNTKSFFVFFSLTIIIILIIYSYASEYNERYVYRTPQGNALNVSPITGEEINSVLQKEEAYIVTFPKDASINELSGNKQGDIIFESYNLEESKCIYKSLYYNSSPFTLVEGEKINTIPLNDLPTFSFINSIDGLPVYFKNSGKLVHIEYSKTATSTFLYQEGYYKYTSDLNSINPPIVSNLIIQLVDKDYMNNKGNAIILAGGKACSGTWEKTNNTTILKDYKGAPMTLMEGKSWWMTVVEGSLILIE